MNLPCLLFGLWCSQGTLAGPAWVIDGDTISIHGRHVRLAGIDAEELDEPHGEAARQHLRDLIGGRLVTCRWDGWSYNRRVAVCIVGLTQLNAQMVADGFALDCAHYSKGLYRSLEPAGARQRLIQKPYC